MPRPRPTPPKPEMIRRDGRRVEGIPMHPGNDTESFAFDLDDRGWDKAEWADPGTAGWELVDSEGHIWFVADADPLHPVLRGTRSTGRPPAFPWSEVMQEVLERARREGIPSTAKHPRQIFLQWLEEAFENRDKTPGDTMLGRYATILVNRWEAEAPPKK